jgi:hypothetical protein
VACLMSFWAFSRILYLCCSSFFITFRTVLSVGIESALCGCLVVRSWDILFGFVTVAKNLYDETYMMSGKVLDIKDYEHFV